MRAVLDSIVVVIGGPSSDMLIRHQLTKGNSHCEFRVSCIGMSYCAGFSLLGRRNAPCWRMFRCLGR